MSTQPASPDAPDPKQAWKAEAARTADENCQRFYDFADMLTEVPNLTSPIKPATGTDQAKQLLLALFGVDGVVCAALSASSFKLIPAGKFGLKKAAAPEGAFFKVNAVTAEKPSGRKGGVTDSDCATEYLMLEMDRASKERQRIFWRAAIALGFPAISVTDSGGKSLHVIIRIAAEDRDDYKATADRILHLLEPFIPDGTSRNPSRYTRLPGVIRGEGEDQRPQDLLYLNPGAPEWSWESDIVQTLECFAAQALPVPQKVKSALSKARERISKEPDDVDIESNKDFRKRLDKVLHNRVIDLEKFVKEAGWHHFSSEPVKGLEGKHFIACPWCEEHTGGGDDDTQTDAYIFERVTTARFKWGFHCSHHVCQERQTIDLLELAAAESPELFTACLEADNDVLASFEALVDIEPPATPVTVPESLLLSTPCDVDNVEIFRLRYQDIARYFHNEGVWALWDGSRWKRDECAGVDRLAAKVWEMRVQAAGSDADAIARAKTAGSLSLSKSLLPIAAVSSDFDLNPYLLGCPNGVLDLRTGELRKARPEDHITFQTGVKYDPAALCPRFDRFLGEIHPDNPDISLFLQRWFGYCLCGSTQLDKMMIFHGSRGRNGKSTLVRVMSLLMGDYCRTMASGFLSSSGRPSNADGPTPSLMGLRNRRLAFTSETNEGIALDEAKVKMLTGGDVITGRGMYDKKEVSFRPATKMVLSSNHRPEIKGTDPAIWARILLVEFKESFLGKEDHSLEKDLENELEGIFAWAVRGYAEFRRHGLQVPQEVTEATNDYQREEDRLKLFLDDCTEIGGTATVAQAGLYQVYAAWAEKNNVRPMWSAKKFSEKMRERGFKLLRSNCQKLWCGVACSSVAE
jgi:putative DNA primase/helicase